MTRKHDLNDAGESKQSEQETPASPTRRKVLRGMALAGAALATGCRFSSQTIPRPPRAHDSSFDAALRRQIQNVVVIFSENRSFNNLFAAFPGLQQPLSSVSAERFVQRDRDGSVLTSLPPVWQGLVPLQQVVNDRAYQIGEDAIVDLANAPWALHTPDGEPLPQVLVTRDLVHRFHVNQMQINGGRNDGFVAWGDSGALVMGHYATSPDNLRLWQLARQYTLCDNFFMGAFGGSFLNHQYLVAAQPPYYPDAAHSRAKSRIAVPDGEDPNGPRLKLADNSPASALKGPPKFTSHPALTPDFRAVNTFGPPYAPGFSVSATDPRMANLDNGFTLPPQSHSTIGDTLSARNVDWAWYAGGWQLALEGKGRQGVSADFPARPNFQPHHQPLNYFRQFAPGTSARKRHLRDGGVGGSASTNRLLADIATGRLPPVTFYKPQGNLNMHAGYSDIEAGDRHIARVIDALREGPQWQHMLVVITVDENGGWWDHVAPPRGDRWGPGTRIPAVVVSPFARQGHVDHTTYDTGSIQRFLNRRFGLDPLPGIRMRDEAMLAGTGEKPGDLTAALDLG